MYGEPGNGRLHGPCCKSSPVFGNQSTNFGPGVHFIRNTPLSVDRVEETNHSQCMRGVNSEAGGLLHARGGRLAKRGQFRALWVFQHVVLVASI